MVNVVAGHQRLERLMQERARLLVPLLDPLGAAAPVVAENDRGDRLCELIVQAFGLPDVEHRLVDRNLLRIFDPGLRSEEDQRGDSLGVAERETQGEEAALASAPDHSFFDSEVVEQPLQVVGEVPVAERVSGVLGVAVAAIGMPDER